MTVPEKWYTPFELTRRLDAIPTISIVTFSEFIIEETVDGDAYVATVTIRTEDDKQANQHVEEVIDNAPFWEVTQEEVGVSEEVEIRAEVQLGAPINLFDKFGLE